VIVAVSAWITVIGTLAGAAVGVIGGGLVTWFVETRRWKREDRIRWHPDRRQVYARFLKAADDYTLAGARYATTIDLLRGSTGTGGADLLIEADEELRKAADALRPEEWEVELVGGRDVRMAAAEVIWLATRQREAELSESSIGHIVDSSAVAKAEKAAEETREAVEKFKRAAREEIGLSE
jgi:hypothetical protein